MADFHPAYKNILRFEGGYVNNPNDKGGETFAGVARKSNPNWDGWSAIDDEKKNFNLKDKAQLKKLNDVLFADTDLMRSHYNLTKQKYWDAVKGDEINNQKLAEFIFDWFWGSGYSGLKGVQAGINATKVNSVPVDGKFTSDTLHFVNTLPEQELYTNLYGTRERFYHKIVEKNPSQVVFLKGWLNRLKSFADETLLAVKKNSNKLAVIGTFGALALAATLIKKKKKSSQ